MKVHWILFCSAIFLLTSYQNGVTHDSESWIYSLISNENTEKVSSTNLLSRQKRAVTSNMLEYVADVEISFSDPQFLVLFRNVLSGLELPISRPGPDVIIQSINISTECNIRGDQKQCSCGSGYKWPTDVCTANPPCSSTVSQHCSCISKFPLEGQYCQLPLSQVIAVNMSITILSPFTEDLKNSSSGLYMDYKTRLETVFNENYKTLDGFRSATVTGFRKGSTIADYTILMENFTVQDLEDANSGVIGNLSEYYKLGDPPITTVLTHLTNFTVSPDPFFEGDDLMLKCETKSNSVSITWLNGSAHISGNSTRYTIYPSKIQEGVSVSILKIANITFSDQGIYTCLLNQSGITYKNSYNISVSPLAFIKSNDVSIVCNGSDVKVLKCCREGGNIDSLNATWTNKSGSSAILGISGNTSSCFTYTLNATEKQCRPESSGEETTYKCEIKAGNVIKTSKEIKVKFYRNANVTISSNNQLQVSVGESFSLTCTSDVTNVVNVSWEIIDETTKEEKLIDQKYYNPINKTHPTSVLNATASKDWNGTYRCNVSQDIVRNSANTTIIVFPLPLQNEIIVHPSIGIFKCPESATIKCCVIKGDYDVKININNILLDIPEDSTSTNGNQVCYIKKYPPDPCHKDTGNFTAYCRFKNSKIKENKFEVRSPNIRMTKISDDVPLCNDSQIGIGKQKDENNMPCQLKYTVSTGSPMGGNLTYRCNIPVWQIIANNCISASINTLLSSAQHLNSSPQLNKTLDIYLTDLRNITKQEQNVIQKSTGNLNAMVQILSVISEVPNITVTQRMMENFLTTVNTIVENNTIDTWKNLSEAGKEDSSLLLRSVENFAKRFDIANQSISITDNENVQLQGITVRNNINEHYNKSFHFRNSTGNVFMKLDHLQPDSRIVSIAYSTLKDILPKPNNTNASVNGLVMSTVLAPNNNLSDKISISMTFSVSNLLLQNPECAFWNFSLSSGHAGWDNTGCQPKMDGDKVNCVCSHLTSFSILMSPSDNEEEDHLLSVITYIGVGISLGSLVLCIIIEALVWKSVTKNRTSYMRHVCFVNIVVSLLIADIWFIIGAIPNIYNYSNVCVVITFFSHFFYLSLFFWMLAMALMLLYLLVYVFQDLSKSTMIAIAFCLGYGCPLIISIITIAVTQPVKHYTKQKNCWLNVNDSKAFLAFVVPALTIVAVNFVIFLITTIKILRPAIGDKPRTEERRTLLKIAKSIAILTPLLGLTWGFGLGVTINDNKILHAIFAALNSFQGFFILVFVTLWDKKVREALMNKCRLSKWPSLHTKSTLESSTENPKTLSRAINTLFGKTGIYKISSAATSSITGTTSDSHSLLK